MQGTHEQREGPRSLVLAAIRAGRRPSVQEAGQELISLKAMVERREATLAAAASETERLRAKRARKAVLAEYLELKAWLRQEQDRIAAERQRRRVSSVEGTGNV
jgi:hypothetical protein